MSIVATVENDTIKLPPGVHVPDGTKVEITLPQTPVETAQTGNPLHWTLKYSGVVEGPEDFAAEHGPERAVWLAQSERRLREVWDNEADDVYNELLAP